MSSNVVQSFQWIKSYLFLSLWLPSGVSAFSAVSSHFYAIICDWNNTWPIKFIFNWIQPLFKLSESIQITIVLVVPEHPFYIFRSIRIQFFYVSMKLFTNGFWQISSMEIVWNHSSRFIHSQVAPSQSLDYSKFKSICIEFGILCTWNKQTQFKSVDLIEDLKVVKLKQQMLSTGFYLWMFIH